MYNLSILVVIYAAKDILDCGAGATKGVDTPDFSSYYAVQFVPLADDCLASTP
jgi:hypothetical protein